MNKGQEERSSLVQRDAIEKNHQKIISSGFWKRENIARFSGLGKAGLRIRGGGIRTAGVLAGFGLVLLVGLTVAPLAKEQQYAEAATGTAQESWIGFGDVAHSNAMVAPSLNLAVNDMNGTFVTTDGGAAGTGTRGTFSVATNNVSGYYLTISASDDTGQLSNSEAATTMSSISSSMNAGTFDAMANNGLWGYKPSKYMSDATTVVDNSNASTGVYLPAPTTTVTPLDKPTTRTSSATTQAAATSGEFNNYTIDLAARLQYTQAGGSYTKTFILTATGNPVTYSITYSDNTGDSTVANLPARQYNDDGTSSTSITLTNSTPTRTGYSFAGWCLGTVTHNSNGTNDTCSGTTYSAGGSFGIDQTTTNDSTLYAMWSPNSYTCTKQYQLQNADGTYTTITSGTTTEQVAYNATCTYTKTLTSSDTADYQYYQNYSSKTTSGTMPIGGLTLTIQFPRNTYALTVARNDSTYITSVSGAGTYRWGQTVNISATVASNAEFVNWTQSGTAGTFGNANSASTTFTMGKGTATVTANGENSAVSLYDTIAAMSKGKQTAADLKTAITVPTSADRTQDTSNSGVYEYDASVFGASSDASNDYAIYYYRGVLENNPGTYGSDGSAVTYPNYVKLSNNTCWRIVRTTGSGGVKMIYNGTYGATTSGSCANATDNAQVTTNKFGTSYSGYIVDVGYTYNNSVRTSTSSTSVDTVFGSNSNYSVNSSASPMKTYLEGTWYSGNMTSYTSKLEPSAGYCNDRVVYSGSTGGTALTSVVPYKTSSATAYFNAYVRNVNASNKPSLTCARSTVDLYTTSSASNGNKQLSYPAALLTADEASFAGSGYYNNSGSSYYHANAFLRSGSVFWLLSPGYRYSGGYVFGFSVRSDGYLYLNYVSYANGVRPAVSFTSGTMITGGSGTATDPWTIE